MLIQSDEHATQSGIAEQFRAIFRVCPCIVRGQGDC